MEGEPTTTKKDEDSRKKKESVESSKKKRPSGKPKAPSTKPKKVKLRESPSVSTELTEDSNIITHSDQQECPQTDNCTQIVANDKISAEEPLSQHETILITDSDPDEHNRKSDNNNVDVDLVKNAIQRIKTPSRMLNDDALNEIITRLFYSNIMQKKGIVYISSLNLSNVLTKEYEGEYDRMKSEEDRQKLVRAKLGIPKDMKNPEEASAIIVVIHGPHTEKERNESCVYNFDEINAQNNHWSLLVWYSSGQIAYHYDSLSNLNFNRCRETLAVLKKYKLVPEALERFFIPEFVPEQNGLVECGWYVLLWLKVLADSCENAGAVLPISDNAIFNHYKKWLDNITANDGKLKSYILEKMQDQLIIASYGNL
ncbi:MAG TPA: hypothetical protein ENI23_02140 [bacterium]|nr:hypothetical protein [bacterium]